MCGSEYAGKFQGLARKFSEKKAKRHHSSLEKEVERKIEENEKESESTRNNFQLYSI